MDINSYYSQLLLFLRHVVDEDFIRRPAIKNKNLSKFNEVIIELNKLDVNNAKFISRSYDAVMLWAKSKHAVSILSTVSFVESFIFPIPPDLLLIPLSISNPKKAYILHAYNNFFSPWWSYWVFIGIYFADYF